MATLTAAVQLAWPAVLGARQAGLSVEDLLGPLGLSWSEVCDPVRRLPYGLLCRIWDRAAELSGDEGFGLRVVGAAPPGTMGALDYLLDNTPSLSDKIACYAQYQRLYQDATEVELSIESRFAVLRYRAAPGAPISHVLTDYAFASILHHVRQLARDPTLRPSEVWLRRKERAASSAHRDYFRCRLRFEEERSALYFSVECLARSFPHDPLLHSVMESQVSRLMDGLPPRSELLQRVAEAVTQALAEGVRPRVIDVAPMLAMSARTLRRRLRDEGTGFREIVDRQRRELALRYLDDPESSTASTAARLGFSDPKSLSKAFRRWAGMSPRDYRARTGAR